MSSGFRGALNAIYMPVAGIFAAAGVLGIMREGPWTPFAAGLMLIGLWMVYFRIRTRLSESDDERDDT